VVKVMRLLCSVRICLHVVSVNLYSLIRPVAKTVMTDIYREKTVLELACLDCFLTFVYDECSVYMAYFRLTNW